VEGRVVRRGVDRGESKHSMAGTGGTGKQVGKGRVFFFSARVLGAGGWVWGFWLPAWLRVHGAWVGPGNLLFRASWRALDGVL
jgi:hypothetical protein